MSHLQGQSYLRTPCATRDPTEWRSPRVGPTAESEAPQSGDCLLPLLSRRAVGVVGDIAHPGNAVLHGQLVLDAETEPPKRQGGREVHDATLLHHCDRLERGPDGCEIVGRAKVEQGKVSVLPDEERPVTPMGDSAIFRMLESYVNFSIDLKTRFAKDPGEAPSPREEIEARPGSVASCPQVVDEILVSQADEEAARMRDESLEAFKDQTDRPIDWFVEEFDIQNVEQPKDEES